jgi:DNA-binding MarR family transcriptional regulator
MPKESCDLDWSKSFMYAIHQTHFLIEKHLEQKLTKARGITFAQFLILLPLHCTPRASQKAIAVFLYLTEATVSRHINSLTKEKLVTNKADPDNRRKHILEMTPTGKRAFEKAHKIIEEELKKIFNIVSAKEREHVSRAFEKVLKQLLNAPMTK